MIIKQAIRTTKAETETEVERVGRGRFRPAVLRDAFGRKLVPADPRDVERRLKARPTAQGANDERG